MGGRVSTLGITPLCISGQKACGERLGAEVDSIREEFTAIEQLTQPTQSWHTPPVAADSVPAGLEQSWP
jgi:hypothetical protein